MFDEGILRSDMGVKMMRQITVVVRDFVGIL